MPIANLRRVLPIRRLRKKHPWRPDDVSFVERPSHRALTGIPATIFGGGGNSPVFRRDLDHFLAGFDRNAERLFSHNIHTGFQARYGGDVVMRMRRANVRAVELFYFQHLFDALLQGQARAVQQCVPKRPPSRVGAAHSSAPREVS